jgi:pre-rRNA-processing protein TSR3
LSTFSYGEAFLEINAGVLKRYAACTSEEQVKAAEAAWLAKIEGEYNDSRADKDGEDEDAWAGGNHNRRALDDSENDSEDENGSESERQKDLDGDEEDSDGGPNRDMPEYSDDEHEMAELRRKVLQSKPFANLKETNHGENERPLLQTEPPPPSRTMGPDLKVDDDSDALSGTDIGEDEDFDNIIQATPVTDRTGISAKQRAKQLDNMSATFSSGSVTAPKKW